MERLIQFQARSVGEIICWRNDLPLAPVAAIWMVVTLLAWLCRKPSLRLCWVMMVVTPLPVEFLPGRGQGCLYIPMAAWVAFAAILLVDTLRAVSAFLFRVLHKDGVAAVLVALAAFYWGIEVWKYKQSYINTAAAQQGMQTREMIRQFEQMRPSVRPGGTIVFLHNPFEGWDMAFIAELVMNDRRLDIRLQDHNPLPEAEFPSADAIFDYRDGKLIRVR